MDLKPKLSLNLSNQSISLWQCKDGADQNLMGEIPTEDRDLGVKLAALRQKSFGMIAGRIKTQVRIPRSEVLFTNVKLSVFEGEAALSQARKELGRLTGIREEELVFDLGPKGVGNIAPVAAVSIITLQEAEVFARQHGFNPSHYTCDYDGVEFPHKPHFFLSEKKSSMPIWKFASAAAVVAGLGVASYLYFSTAAPNSELASEKVTINEAPQPDVIASVLPTEAVPQASFQLPKLAADSGVEPVLPARLDNLLALTKEGFPDPKIGVFSPDDRLAALTLHHDELMKISIDPQLPALNERLLPTQEEATTTAEEIPAVESSVVVHSGRPAITPPPRKGEALAEEPASIEAAVVVHSGRPDVTPPARKTVKPANEPIESEVALARPKNRPSGLRPVAVKPEPPIKPEPETTAAEAEVEESAPATELAVLTSLTPVKKPRNFNSIVRKTRAVAVRPTSTPATPSSSPSPTLPTAASVANEATENLGIRRNSMSLIGVFGPNSALQAMVRLPSGKFVKVKKGDKLSGWRISAISSNSLRMAKGSRNRVLTLPK